MTYVAAVPPRAGCGPGSLIVRWARVVAGLARVRVEPGVLGGATWAWGGWQVQIAEGEDAVRVEGGGVCGGGLSSLSAHYQPASPCGVADRSPCTYPSTWRGVGGGRMGG